MTYEPPLHPDYNSNEATWTFWRESFEGGENYKKHLEKFSFKEDNQDFQARTNRSYVPNFCKSLINEIKNAIYRPMKDIIRIGGTESYQRAIKGLDLGVDKLGSNMNMFIGEDVICELLFMGKVGVFIDAPQEKDENYRPYLYTFKREDILNWVESPNNPDEFVKVLLRKRSYSIDEDTGYPQDTIETFLNITKNPDGPGVTVEEIDAEGASTTTDLPEMTKIPFHMVSIGESLISDLVDYQKALYNLESTDINFLTQSNFPFYVEQHNFSMHSFAKGFDNYGEDDESDADTGTPNADTTSPDVSKDSKQSKSGLTGRRYDKGLNSPAFIHPSSEPVTASMAKQEKMKQDMRQLLNLTIENLNPQRISTKSKEQEREGLMAGLSFIGQILLKAEVQIARTWSEYENQETEVKITYPANYVVKSVSETIAEVDSLNKLAYSVPSLTYTKELQKTIARKMLETAVPDDVMNTILSEIDSQTVQANVVQESAEVIYQGQPASSVEQEPTGQQEPVRDEVVE